MGDFADRSWVPVGFFPARLVVRAAFCRSRGLLKTDVTSVGAAMDEPEGEAALSGEPYDDDEDMFYDANDEIELGDEEADDLVVVDAVDDTAAPAGEEDEEDDFGGWRGEDEEFVRSLVIEDEDNDEVTLTRLKELSDKDVFARTTVDESVVDVELGAKCIAHMEKVAR